MISDPMYKVSKNGYIYTDDDYIMELGNQAEFLLQNVPEFEKHLIRCLASTIQFFIDNLSDSFVDGREALEERKKFSSLL